MDSVLLSLERSPANNLIDLSATFDTSPDRLNNWFEIHYKLAQTSTLPTSRLYYEKRHQIFQISCGDLSQATAIILRI
jgi:hypothetical protein